MNLSLVALCWIAVSTLLGVLFSYSSLGLTTSTSVAALLIGAIIATLQLYLRKRIPLVSAPENCLVILLFGTLVTTVVWVKMFHRR